MAKKYIIPLENLSSQLPVKDKDLNAAPTSGLTVGDRYIVAAAVASADAWVGQEGNIAWYDENSTWQFITASEGWQVHVDDEDKFYVYTGAAWTDLGTYLGAGAGDMTKVVYDTDDDGIVDKAEALDDDSGNTLSAAEGKTAYDRRAQYNASLGMVIFDNL